MDSYQDDFMYSRPNDDTSAKLDFEGDVYKDCFPSGDSGTSEVGSSETHEVDSGQKPFVAESKENDEPVSEADNNVDENEEKNQKSEDKNNSVSSALDITEMLNQQTSIAQKVGRLENSMSSMASESKEMLLQLKRQLEFHQNNEDRLRKEVDSYKRDEKYVALKPLLEFMIDMRIDFAEMLSDYQEKLNVEDQGPDDSLIKEICNTFAFNIKQIDQVLRFQGVVVKTFQPGDEYSVGENQVMRAFVETNDETLTGKIAMAVNDCYLMNDKVIKQAKVKLYKYVKE